VERAEYADGREPHMNFELFSFKAQRQSCWRTPRIPSAHVEWFVSVLFAVLLMSTAVVAEELRGTVERVIDGDTIVLRVVKPAPNNEDVTLSEDITIRLYGVDCPEKGQGYWKAAKQLTSDLTAKNTLVVELKKQKTYGRSVGTVKLPDGRILNEELLRAGLCWWDHTYSKDVNWGHLEIDARAAGKGLWVDRTQIPPWAFRRDRNARPSTKGEGSVP